MDRAAAYNVLRLYELNELGVLWAVNMRRERDIVHRTISRDHIPFKRLDLFGFIGYVLEEQVIVGKS